MKRGHWPASDKAASAPEGASSPLNKEEDSVPVNRNLKKKQKWQIDVCIHKLKRVKVL